jgi:transposase
MLEHFKTQGLLKARGKQRTDSMHMLAAIRTLNRPESVGETFCATLNTLARVAPEWLREHAESSWFDRYSYRIEESRLLKGQTERQQYAELIGSDGSRLLSLVYEPAAPAFLKELSAIQLLRQSWVFQYYADDERLRWRKAEDFPPAAQRYDSPYETASSLWQ